MKKIGGVKITMQRVSAPQPREKFRMVPSGMCECGKSNAECVAWWDQFLGITGWTGGSAGGTKDEYKLNLEKIKRAQQAGHDPYHFRLSLGEREWVWTPHSPPGSFKVSLELSPGKPSRLSSEVLHGTPRGTGNQRERGTKRTARGKRR